MDHIFVAQLDQALSLLRADYRSTLSHAIERDLQVVQSGIADLQLTASTIIDTSLEIKSDTTALRDDTAVRHKRDLMGWVKTLPRSYQPLTDGKNSQPLLQTVRIASKPLYLRLRVDCQR
jgi:hypothetical protein